MKYVSLRIFLVCFIIGLFFSYILGPERKIVYVYPTLTNSTNTIFKDKAGQCFRFKSKEVTGPSDLTNIKHIPIQ
jgi:hypothetical protein